MWYVEVVNTEARCSAAAPMWKKSGQVDSYSVPFLLSVSFDMICQAQMFSILLRCRWMVLKVTIRRIFSPGGEQAPERENAVRLCRKLILHISSLSTRFLCLLHTRPGDQRSSLITDTPDHHVMESSSQRQQIQR